MERTKMGKMMRTLQEGFQCIDTDSIESGFASLFSVILLGSPVL
mgnify:CR=1 FL=1